MRTSSFNIIGVAVMLPLFFLSMQLLTWVMGWFGGDPGVPVVVDGKETFPLVPVAVGLYSTFFNIFNTRAAVPLHRRVRARAVARSATRQPRMSRTIRSRAISIRDSTRRSRPGVPAIQQETERYLEAAGKFLDIAPGQARAPDDVEEHFAAIDVLSREIRGYTAACSRPNMPYAGPTCWRA